MMLAVAALNATTAVKVIFIGLLLVRRDETLRATSYNDPNQYRQIAGTLGSPT
jgi:hypothetical protein